MVSIVRTTTTGGSKLKSHLRRMNKKLSEAKSVSVGFFSEDIHPDAHVPVAQVMYWNEYGVPELNIPARPAFRATVALYHGTWNPAFQAGLKAANYSADAALSGLGALITKELKGMIRGWREPPNAASTVARKGFNNPLIETRYMVNHVKYKVAV